MDRAFRTMVGSVGAVVAATVATMAGGCSIRVAGPPDPTVTGMTPSSGDWGTLVTASGDHLERAASVIGTGPNGETVDMVMEVSANVQDAGVRTTLPFRVPFPAEGTLSLVSLTGATTPIGAFTPSWAAGTATNDTPWSVVAAATLGTIVVAFANGSSPSFLVWDGASGAVRVVATGLSEAPADVAMTSDDKVVTALVLTQASALSVVSFDGTTATVSAFGALPADVTGMGIGADASPFAYGVQNDMLVRFRASAGAADAVPIGAPIPLPDTWGTPFTALTTTAGGTIVFLDSTNVSTLLDDYAEYAMFGLDPGATTFSAPAFLGDIDDVRTKVSAKHEGGLAKLTFCGIQNGTFDLDPTEECRSAVTLDGKAPFEAAIGNTTTTEAIVAATPERLHYAACVGDVLHVETVALQGSLGPEERDDEATLYPCTMPAALAFESSGAPHLVVDYGGRLYAASRRP